jgi:magnesium chelatase subunit D
MHAEYILPLPALVGLDAARQALLLLAVDPRLEGVVVSAAAGSGKSSLARGFASLQGEGAPFVELPLGADEESLLGGIDLEATLYAGGRVLRRGALARADGGAIYVDGLNLLADSTANLLMAALDRAELQIEREGISERQPARFCLLASYDPAEGQPRRHLLDRVGLLAVLPPTAGTDERAEVIRRNVLRHDRRPTTDDRRGISNDRPSSIVNRRDWEEELALLQGLVLAAREQLPRVSISDEQIEQLLSAAVLFGVQGHRADLFAVRVACAAAALALRDTVVPDDLELALRLVILPRATRIPTSDERQTTNDERPPESQETQEHGTENREPRTAEPQNQEPSIAEPEPQTGEQETQSSEPKTQNSPLEEQVLEALAAELPLDLAALPFRAQRRGRSGSRGSTNGKRGRHIRSTAGDPRRARIDIAATLRAAAPLQRIRDQGSGVREQKYLAWSPTPDPRPFMLYADDLRIKHFRSKAGALFCFAVDASGSMALHRMRQAKGAVHALLQQAYVHRDRVALLAFRGSAADVLLPPSQSVELARRALDLLPTGGGTPMAAALLRALDIARQARGRGIQQVVLVLLTDGRANVGLRAARAEIAQELQLLGRQVADAGIQAVVVDTQRSYLGQGEARRLAGWLHGEYIYLPNASGAQIAGAALAARGDEAMRR